MIDKGMVPLPWSQKCRGIGIYFSKGSAKKTHDLF
ncbi:predicted protein [Sclerotinia sclerotiorum 1980 UF-70]|uniref:Uncharacterized protein n=1 Tax=Sclerotinia sclerotiorum (strain ATCC 18683 / 1980 / Ss-1) TaxID=665079 RepID=A7F3H1_SCLS1|nr:predicted protein [Sclerotinia sclerotiorum 1980 UF-70]EDN97292.1 predicted protein [Sclerotinia sclerotiorum 1980 UF-70]